MHRRSASAQSVRSESDQWDTDDANLTKTLSEDTVGFTNAAWARSAEYTQPNIGDAFNDDRFTDTTSLASLDEESPWTKKAVLAIDGGGIRGYSSLIILRALMNEIAQLERISVPSAYASTGSTQYEAQGSRKSRNSASSTFLPCHYFDYVAGTGTGGLIAIMLGRLRMSVDAAIAEYENLSKEILASSIAPGGPHIAQVFHTRSKSQVLASCMDGMKPAQPSLGEDQKGHRFDSDDKRCRTIVCAMERGVDKARNVVSPYLFRSYEHINRSRTLIPFERNPGQATRCSISEVAQAAIPAPGLFRSFVVGEQKFSDPGPGLNNPSCEIYHEVKLMQPHIQDPVSTFVSIGCGYDKADESSRYFGSRAWKSKSSHKGMQKELALISDSIHAQMQREAKHSGFHYQRFDVKDNLSSKLLCKWKRIEPGRPALDRVRFVTESYLDDVAVQKELRICAHRLVEQRRERAATMHWERFALGTCYRCKHSDVCSEQLREQLFQDKNELMDHLREEHDEAPLNADNFQRIVSLLERGRTGSNDL